MSGRWVHRSAGLAAGAAAGDLAAASGASLHAAVGLVVVAAATAGGGLSPDLDQYGWWRRLDRWVADEALGHGGPLRHRGVTHWWGTVVVCAAAWAVASGLGVPWWLGVGQVTGWGSHLVMDWVFGRRVVDPQGRLLVPAGVPVWPWWGHVGGWWRSGGRGSQTVGWLLVPVWLVLLVPVMAGVG